MFKIVTCKKSNIACSERISKFLTEFRTTLTDMKPDDFKSMVNSLAKFYLEKFNSLSELTTHYWSEVKDRRYKFDISREEVVALKDVSKTTLLEFFDRHFCGEGRKRLSVHVVGGGGGEEGVDASGNNSNDDFAQIRSWQERKTYHEVTY